MLKLYSCPLSGLFLVYCAFKRETHYECSVLCFKIDPRLCGTPLQKAKQAIFMFTPMDQKCLVHSRGLTDLDKGHSQE
jgi:hypothetical protein